MIDEKILDEILPKQSLDELKDTIVNQLEDEGFVITNYNSGGIFNILLMIVLNIRIELVDLLRSVLNNMFISHAEGDWLELKAADFSKKIKQATKTKGKIKLLRTAVDQAIKIEEGTIFKTERDINGDELFFLSTKTMVFEKGASDLSIEVIAEQPGSKYNVPPRKIKLSLTHIETIDAMENQEDWLISEGSDTESIENLRQRVLNSWSELATFPISDKYRNIAESVEGVLFATVDDIHPRGQGTIDIIITSVTGTATQELLDKVSDALEEAKAPYDNILVKASEVVRQDIELVIYIAIDANEDGIIEKVNSILNNLFKIEKDRTLNILYKDNIVFALKSGIAEYKKTNISCPATDIELKPDKVIILGETKIKVERV